VEIVTDNGDDAATLATLRAERDSAVARARELEMELGELRGRVKRLELIMWRRTARRQLWQARIDRVMAKVRRS
jgi:hypothetical protein